MTRGDRKTDRQAVTERNKKAQVHRNKCFSNKKALVTLKK